MEFTLGNGILLLERTPGVVRAMLEGLPDEWLHATEGGDTWSVFTVVGHLIHCEEADWLPRARIILEHGASRPFDPFDRFAQFEKSKGKTCAQLLDQFTILRAQNLDLLRGFHLSETDFGREGMHPALGPVTLKQLLAAWVAHDLTHIHQISRVLAVQYRYEVGPWGQYMGVMQSRRG